MEDEIFEKYFERIEEIYEIETLADDGIPAHLWNPEYREEKLKEILEEIYQKGKDDKFKDIGYLDVDEYYPEKKEAKP